MASTDTNTIAGHKNLVKHFSEMFPRVFAEAPFHTNDFFLTLHKENKASVGRLIDIAEGDERALKEVIGLMFFLVRWNKFGMPVFQITQDLLAGLALTDPSNVPVEEVQLPFPTFIIDLPSGFWELENDDAVYGGGRLATLSRSKKGESSDIAFITVSTMRSFIDGSDNEENDLISISSTSRAGINMWDRLGWPPEGETIGTWPLLGIQNLDERYKWGMVKDQERAMQVCIRQLIINLSLYIQGHGRGERVSAVKKGGKKRKKQSKISNTWIIGRNIKVGPEVVSAAKAAGVAKKGWKVKVRSIVRGHFKSQPHGEGRALRKRIFVKPYPRGPKEGVAMPHIYNLGE